MHRENPAYSRVFFNRCNLDLAFAASIAVPVAKMPYDKEYNALTYFRLAKYYISWNNSSWQFPTINGN